jgi:hypothetical protein
VVLSPFVAVQHFIIIFTISFSSITNYYKCMRHIIETQRDVPKKHYQHTNPTRSSIFIYVGTSLAVFHTTPL